MNSNTMYFWCWTWAFTLSYSNFAFAYNNQYCHYIESDQDMYCSQVNIGDLRNDEYPVNHTEIRKLYLKNTHLSKLDYNVFHNLINIRVLDLSKNSLQDLDYRLFSKSRQLNKLYISHNKLNILDERLFNGLNNLTHLNLAYNKLIYLPGSKIFESQMKLVYLSVEGNNLTSISLKSLLPLAELKVLKMLYNPFNCICQIWYTVIWAKSKCLKMTATCNSPKELQGKSWKEITITKCKNHTPSIKKNCSIKSCIYNNRLAFMDCSDLKLVSLTRYNLPFNETKFRTLSLQNNDLKFLKPNVFETLPHLRSLNLRINKIRHLEKSIFVNLTNLKYLDLSKNMLTRLETLLFSSQRMLISLKLQENLISTISVEIFKPLISLQRLNIYHNPLVCNNNLKEVFNWFVEKKIFLVAKRDKAANHEYPQWKVLEELCNTSSFSVVNVLVSAVCSLILVFIPLSTGAGVYYYTWTRRQSKNVSPVVKFSKCSRGSSPTVEIRKIPRCNSTDIFDSLEFEFERYVANQQQCGHKGRKCTKVNDTETCTNKINLQPISHGVLVNTCSSKEGNDIETQNTYECIELDTKVSKARDRTDSNETYENIKVEPIYESVEADANSSCSPAYISIMPDLPERPMDSGNLYSEMRLENDGYLQPIRK